MSNSSSTSNGSSSGDAKIKAAKAGDVKALGEALEACRVYLRYIANEELSADLQVKEDASDVVQATLLKAQVKFPDFEGLDRAALRHWLRKILLNTLKDLSRKYQQSEKRQLSKEVPLDGNSQITQAQQMAAEDPTPSEIVMAGEREDALSSALNRLPDDQREVIYLRSRKHLNFIEIGKLLNRSSEAARVLWYRAVQNLAEQLRQKRENEL